MRFERRMPSRVCIQGKSFLLAAQGEAPVTFPAVFMTQEALVADASAGYRGKFVFRKALITSPKPG